MAPSLVKYNWTFPWDQTANGFQFLKSSSQFPAEPFFFQCIGVSDRSRLVFNWTGPGSCLDVQGTRTEADVLAEI